MNDIVTSENSYVDLTSPISEELSPYDATYPIAFLSNSLKSMLAQAQIAAEKVYKVVAKEAPVLAQVQQSMKKGCRYVVDATESTIKDLECGKIRFTHENGGKMYAQLRQTNGNYGSKVPIKKEVFRKGIDPIQMANALQMMALQEQIQAIAEQINVIDHRVREVLQGQQNDRIGLYYSGMALYLESRNIADNEMRNVLMAQSLRALSEAACQLTLTMQSDIRYLVNKEYEREKKGERVKLIDDRMHSINQSFAIIHQAAMMRAGIYCSIGELPAMSTALDEYSHFIEGTVTKNADLLAQCDESDNGTEKGVWKSRTKLRLDVSDIAKQLNMPDKTLYLGMLGETE